MGDQKDQNSQQSQSDGQFSDEPQQSQSDGQVSDEPQQSQSDGQVSDEPQQSEPEDTGRPAAGESVDDEHDANQEQWRREEDSARQAEEFAREHDPANHDIDAGEDFRQRGDWTADEAGEPQVWDNEGHLVEGSETAGTLGAQGESDSSGDQEGQSSDTGQPAGGPGTAGADDGPEESSYDEVRDGGYSVGSAAPVGGNRMPLGHPVKGWEDTKSYAEPGHPSYGTEEPHVWFTDKEAAERAGFQEAQY